MYRYEDIRQVHLEITTRCNANCPQCPRTINGGQPNPNLPVTELSLANIKAIFLPNFIRQLEQIYACGTFGDASVARDTLAILEYFRYESPQLSLVLYTNGGARTVQWWERLAQVNGKVWFGIDGLADTNHIHRQGVNWDVLMRNVRSFIVAGGDAVWTYIPFKHNEHQIDEARALSMDMGFSHFEVSPRGRFYDSRTGDFLTHTSVRDREGKVVGKLERPTDQAYQNLGRLNKASQPLDWEEFLRTTSITCAVQKKKSIYISAVGNVHPCCHVAGQQYSMWGKETEVNRMLATVGNINALTQPLQNVVESYIAEFPKNWEIDQRLRICGRVCGASHVYPN